ncbi:glycosyltransferase family 4 protein [Reinekea thalattae]|uniref:Glycosyltransferase family 4 protein n=1 Tax=Reinekea thalattae TaxID=2593301 RepID=A0A5C8Z5U8_9GAMM|nr:glycosyltransferase family 4 protein [Reinekea thalattae]TXR53342.1 glycosyltransferase family 4 protein [Reinekea thalattae]
MKEIYIYQRVLPHYRIHFFDALHASLLSQGVKLYVVAGFEKSGSVPKTVEINRPWVIYRGNKYISFLGKEIVVQSVLFRSLKRGSVVIVEQSNRLVINYLFWLLRKLKFIKMGLWGHGKNFQSRNPNGFLECFKKRFSLSFDWWFAYTDLGKRIFWEAGCPKDKVTVVYNSIDLGCFNDIQRYREGEVLDFVKFKVSIGDDVGIYCGGMYTEKDLPFLIESIELVKKHRPGFKMIFIGDGPDAYSVKGFSESNDWSIWLGEISGEDRVKYFAYAKVFLMPGLVGLAILDSFASGVPMITTDVAYHSPEIEYLVNDVNGLKVPHNIEAYSDGVISVLANKEFHDRLVTGCIESTSKYSLQNMVNNFANGIQRLVLE